MEFKWEEFEDGQPVETGKRIHATINSKGKLFFNAKAIEALGVPDGVTLLYDRRRSTIGVKPTPLNRKSAFKLRHKDPARSHGQIISAKNFCKRFSIHPEETLAFTDPTVNNDGILILDLNEVRSAKKG
jgi:hypothetical protein